MTLNKLDIYLYEAKRKELNDAVNLPFDELLDYLTHARECERETIISNLDESTKNKVLDIIEGGLL